MKKTSRKSRGITRRRFIEGTAGAIGAAAVGSPGRALAAPKRSRKVDLTLRVNGKVRKLSIEPRVTLLNALRNHLDVTGPKNICDRGACGGCAVLLVGLLVNSCMMLALDAEGKEITTVEGLSQGDTLHPLQEAFCEKDALQCGFCTPGMVMASKALLDRKKNPTLGEIKAGLAGNICRCGTYPRIFEAIQLACKKVR